MKIFLIVITMFLMSCESPPPEQKVLNEISKGIEEYNCPATHSEDECKFHKWNVTYNDYGYILVDLYPTNAGIGGSRKVARLEYIINLKKIQKIRWGVFEARDYDMRIRFYFDEKKVHSEIFEAGDFGEVQYKESTKRKD